MAYSRLLANMKEATEQFYGLLLGYSRLTQERHNKRTLLGKLGEHHCKKWQDIDRLYSVLIRAQPKSDLGPKHVLHFGSGVLTRRLTLHMLRATTATWEDMKQKIMHKFIIIPPAWVHLLRRRKFAEIDVRAFSSTIYSDAANGRRIGYSDAANDQHIDDYWRNGLDYQIPHCISGTKDHEEPTDKHTVRQIAGDNLNDMSHMEAEHATENFVRITFALKDSAVCGKYLLVLQLVTFNSSGCDVCLNSLC
ncbi:hypothetical protein POM88_002016 [Heracleum sosnowskyi]|uniref:Uncharacterized protein n=1 Tax=Heracleum sosnowskyi TaxID=360622 RepID=A0AAD8JEV6_9APIA|nr:hypothetical protein POM88_002016 [Heracleum sosnowskyi]